MWDTISDPRLDRNWRFHVHAERYPLEDLPKQDEELAKWLEDRFVQKGTRLEHLQTDLEDGREWRGDTIELQELKKKT